MFVSAKLQLESTKKDSFVGVRIRSVTENSYLCVNPNGDLTVEVSLLSIVKSSATRFTWPSTPTFLHADNTQLYICCCSKADSSAIQVGSGWGGWSLFSPSLPASYWKQFIFLIWEAKVVFPALYRCMEILWTAAYFKNAYTLGTEYFSQCTTKVGISVLNAMEK